jgi:flagellar basal-body rod modification protein FlgD
MTVSSTSFSPFSTFGTAGSAATPSSQSASASATSSVGTGSVDTLQNTAGDAVGLKTGDFMTLFLAQLQNQDPTQPMDNSQMLSQLAQMTEVQTLQGVQTALQGSQLSSSSALIGKNVTGVDVNGAAVNGLVTSVTQSSDAGLVLQVGSQYVKPTAVVTVTNPTA